MRVIKKFVVIALSFSKSIQKLPPKYLQSTEDVVPNNAYFCSLLYFFIRCNRARKQGKLINFYREFECMDSHMSEIVTCLKCTCFYMYSLNAEYLNFNAYKYCLLVYSQVFINKSNQKFKIIHKLLIQYSKTDVR